MKFHKKIFDLLIQISKTESFELVKKLEEKLVIYITIVLVGELEYPNALIILNEDQKKLFSAITFTIINQRLKHGYHFNNIIKLLSACHLELDSVKNVLSKMHSSNQSKLDDIFAEFKTNKNFIKNLVALPSHREKFYATICLNYGINSFEKAFQNFEQGAQKLQPQKTLGNIALYTLCDKSYDVKIHKGLISHLLKKGATPNTFIKNTTISYIDKNYNLVDIAFLKGCDEVLTTKVHKSIKILDPKILATNCSLFSDINLKIRLSTISYKWTSEALAEAISKLAPLGYFETLIFLLDSNSIIIEATKKLEEGVINIDRTSKVDTIQLNIYNYLFFQLGLLTNEQVVKLITILLEKHCLDVTNPLPLFVLLMSNMNETRKNFILNCLLKSGFDIFSNVPNYELNFIGLLALQNNFFVLDYILTRSILTTKYPNLAEMIYKNTEERNNLNIVLHLHKKYAKKLPNLTSKSLRHYLQQFFNTGYSDYSLIDDLIQFAKENQISLEAPLGFPIDKISFPVPNIALHKGELIEFPQAIYYLSPLSVMLIRNNYQGFIKLYNAGACINKSSLEHNMHPLVLAAAFSSDNILTVLLADQKLNITWDKQSDNEAQRVLEDAVRILIAREKHYHLKLLLTHPNIKNKFTIDIIYFLILLETNFTDMESIKSIWSNEYLELESLYSILTLCCQNESFFLQMCDFVTPKIEENFYKIVENPSIFNSVINNFLYPIVRLAMFAKLKLSYLSETDRASLSKFMGRVDLDSIKVDKKNNNHKININKEDNYYRISLPLVTLPEGDAAQYLAIVEKLVGLLTKYNKPFSIFEFNDSLNLYELICIGDFQRLLRDIIAVQKFNESFNENQQVKILALSATLNRIEIIKILFEYFGDNYTDVSIVHALEAAITNKSEDACSFLLNKLAKLLDNNPNLIPKIKFLFNRLTSEQAHIKSFLSKYFEKLPLTQEPLKNKETLEIEPIKQPTENTTAPNIPTLQGHSTYQFFNSSGHLCYVFINDKILEKNNLYTEVAYILAKNKQNTRFTNKNIVYVGGNPNYGGAIYKIKLWGDKSNMRLLMFASDNNNNNNNDTNSENVQSYICKLMPKHRKG